MRLESKKLLQIQKNSGLNKQQFAESLRISSSVLSKYLGKNKGSSLQMSLSFLRKLRETYSIDLNIFISGDSIEDELVYVPLYEIDAVQNMMVIYKQTRKIPIQKILIDSYSIQLLKAFIIQDSFSEEGISNQDTIIFEESPVGYPLSGLYVIYDSMLKVRKYSRSDSTRSEIKGRVVAILHKVKTNK